MEGEDNSYQVVGNADFIQIVNLMKDAKPFPHVLIWGPSGAGKTTIGKYISNVVGSNVTSYYGPDLDRMTLSMILQSQWENDVLIIDEIHGLSKGLLESIYQPLEEFQFKGMSLTPFTMIGITTDLDSLPDALQRRFRLVYRVQLYDTQELMDVCFGLIKKEWFDDGIEAVAEMSRGSPGIVRNHLQLIESMFEIEKVDFETVQHYQRLKHVNDIGLEEVDLEYLRVLRAYDVLSLSTLSSILVEREKAIEGGIEPFLFRLGLVVKTSKGRQLTIKGQNYLRDLD